MSRAFTLIEILVAVSIMTMCMALVAMIYTNTIKAWRMGQNVMDELHQGDFIAEQLVAALRSEAFFPNNPKVYGFWLDDMGTQSSAHDEVSFVTSSSAFIPTDSPLQNSLHRLWITIGQDQSGREGLSVRALPHIMKEMDKTRVEPWIVSSRVKAFDCQVYDSDTKGWVDSWEDTNKIPPLIRVTLTVMPVHEEDPPLTIQRVIEIPIAPAVTEAVVVASAPSAGTSNAAPVGVGAGAPGAGPTVGIGGNPGGNANRTGGNRTTPSPTPIGPGGQPLPGGGSFGGGTRRVPTPLPGRNGR